MSLTVYEYAKCGTCRSALKWLKARNHEIHPIPLFEQPPSVAELKRIVKASGLDAKKFLNTSGEVYKEMKLKDQIPDMTQDEIIRLMASNGRLIKRPIIVDGDKVTVGFKEEQYERMWG